MTDAAKAQVFWERLLLGLLLFTVFYLPNDNQIPLTTGVRGVNAMNILFAACLFIMARLQRFSDDPLPLKTPLILMSLAILWGGFVALMGDSTAWVEDVTYIKNALFYPLLFVLFFHAIQDMRGIRLVLLMLVFVTFTSTVLGVRQALDYGLGGYNESHRVAAPFGWAMGDANRAAVFYCIYLQVAATGALFLKGHKWIRLGCALTFALGVFVVFQTYSRQAYFIMAVLLVIIALRRHLLVSALVCVVLLNYEMWVPQSVIDRIVMTSVDDSGKHNRRATIEQPTFDSPVSTGTLYNTGPLFDQRAPWQQQSRSGSEESQELVEDIQLDSSTESRLVLWTGAWAIIQERPLGIGLNRFKREIGNYAPRSVAGKDAHNFYVLFTTEAGVLGPVMLLTLMFGLLGLGFRLHGFRADPEARAMSIAFTLATLGMMMGNIYGSRFLDGPVMGNYWILAGITARMLMIKQKEEAQRIERERRDTAARELAQQAAWRETQLATQAARHASGPAQDAGYRAPSTRGPRAPVTSGKLPGSR